MTEHALTTEAELEAVYGEANPNSLVKELDQISDDYRAFIEAAPFVVLATAGPEGLDTSPRGDPAPVAHVLDRRTLALPDRLGNNRIDSLRNIVRDP
ncbi:MAG: pyridoxamine 5'-phosphate oxidase family protein, partial [Pseudomonadota bacterium]